MPVAGERIAGRYLLDCRIAVGGMGAVWLGRDELLRRPVAVKTLHLQAGLAPDDRELIVQRAMREARLTARLHHAHAVQVFDVLDEPDGPCLIMEYVPSRSLHDVVRTGGPLSVDDAARSGTQIAAALAAAHRAGIVHRDVKPGNVLIADDGTAKLTDFGISHAFDDASLTTTGMVTGTPAYLAPEVARGAPSSFASDVYSLGVTMYFAVDGDSPFGSGGNPMAVLHRVASEQPRPPRGAGPLAPLLREMMATRPEDRPRMVDIPVLLTDLHLVPADVAAQATEPLRAAAPPPSPTREFAAAAPPARPAPPAPPPPGPPPARPAADRAPTRAPPSRPARPPSFERRRRGPLIALIAGLVVVAAVVGGVLLADSGGGGSTSADPSTSRSGSSPASRSQSPGPSTTAPGTSTSSSPTAGSTTGPSATSQGPTTVSGKITDADLVSAVTQYFVLIPGDLDGAWARLTTTFQNGRAGGRQSFNDYWGGIERVDVADVQGNAPQAATAQLTYHYRTGKVVTQRTTFRFVREDGELKIDDES